MTYSRIGTWATMLALCRFSATPHTITAGPCPTIRPTWIAGQPTAPRCGTLSAAMSTFFMAMVLGGGTAGNPPVPPETFKASVIISGLFDLAPIAATYINNYIQLDDTDVAALSPLAHVPKTGTQMGPLILGTGEHELAEYFLHQSRYAATWFANGHSLQMCDAPGYQHFDVPYDLTKADGTLHRAFAELIDWR